MFQDDDDLLWKKHTQKVEENSELKVWDKISPKHYKDVVPGYEYMDVMEHTLGFEGTVEHLRGQIFKYLMRFGKKDDRRLEAGKIAWYAARLEDVLERNLHGQFPFRPVPDGIPEYKPSYTPAGMVPLSPYAGT